MFQFKFPSLLQFDQASQADQTLIDNLCRLYSLDDVASDTQMRAILDPVAPSQLRPAFRALHASAQRGKVLEDFAIFQELQLVNEPRAQHGERVCHCQSRQNPVAHRKCAAGTQKSSLKLKL